MLSVLIVGNHPMTRYGLKHILKEEFRDITFGEARMGHEALFEAAKQAWTLIVLDIHGGNGFLVLEEIRRQRPTARVLVLSPLFSQGVFLGARFRVGRAGRAGLEGFEKIVVV
jgi:DNA-binding NarL/FixJ family response regulator